MATNLKISKPMLYFLIAAGGGIVYWKTLPDTSATTKVPVKRTATRSAAKNKDADDLILPADYTAKFASYKGAKHDAFLPGISVAVPGVHTGPGSLGGRGIWTLTGITAINGQDAALVENSVTGSNQTLHVGDRWNDRRVARINADSVTLINAKGQSAELTFPPPEDESKKGANAPIAEAEPEPTPAAPTIIQPNITIQAPIGGGQSNNGGGQFQFGGFPGGGPGGPGGGPGGGGPGGVDNNNL